MTDAERIGERLAEAIDPNVKHEATIRGRRDRLLDAGLRKLVDASQLSVRMAKEFYEAERNEFIDQRIKDHRRRAVFAIAADLGDALAALKGEAP